MNPQYRINDPKTIDTGLNELCGRYNKNFEIRFYGHYSNSFDCKTLLKIPNVKSLYVDCLTKAHNVEAVSALNNLQKLSLGIYEMKETEILNAENLKTLSELIVTEKNIQNCPGF